MLRYLITLQATDKEGLVESIANKISHYGGNWLDSEMRHIDGVFAAILQLEFPEAHWDHLLDDLTAIESLTLTYSKTSKNNTDLKRAHYRLVANDRIGLVQDISNKMRALNINIERFSSQYETASHTGIALFRADFNVSMKQDQDEELIQALYDMGDDVVLDKIDE
ncbi:glycine cleavage system protein R [Shewanella surugensis]|uniref:Glycine cleavage system transcriptional repressor n=1 Tax=Shewanella surugensis TaxID=212020 RepID=A0ABT0L7P7_9GAMM|nr:ACT domain-containing protein [Shewanella surugensis]MCL1123713.1 amino acid-binding protein [Shewanella surugensis]